VFQVFVNRVILITVIDGSSFTLTPYFQIEHFRQPPSFGSFGKAVSEEKIFRN
jgi:hypothetical protein